MIANIIFIITVSLLHSNVGFELTKMAVWRAGKLASLTGDTGSNPVAATC